MSLVHFLEHIEHVKGMEKLGARSCHVPIVHKLGVRSCRVLPST